MLGWMGDAQASADEANMNFDMQSFYMEFLNKVRKPPSWPRSWANCSLL